MNKIKIATGLVLLAAVSFGLFIAASTKTDSYMLQWADNNTITRPQTKNVDNSSVVDSVGYVTGTGSDTTTVFNVLDFMSMAVTLNDTSDDDSTQVRLDVYVAMFNQYRRRATPLFSEFYRIGQFTVTGDTIINIFGCDTPFGQVGYIDAVGGDDNKKVSATEVRIQMIGQR